MLRAELINLNKHCLATKLNIELQRDRLEIVAFRKAKYNGGNLFVFDIKDAYILNENLFIDVMRLYLFVRNNEIEIDELIALARENKLEGNLRKDLRDRLIWRMQATVEVSEELIRRVDKNMRDPLAYVDPPLTYPVSPQPPQP